MEYKMTVQLPLKFSLNVYERMFYVKRNEVKKEFYEAVRYPIKVEGRMPQPPYEVQYDFLIWGAGMDLSNLMGMVKPLEDGLVKTGLFEDDNASIVKKLILTEGKAPEETKKNKQSYVEITVRHIK